MNVSTVGQSYKNILIVFTAICMFTQCIAELFTAVTDMEEMLDTETVLIDNLETYVRLQEHQLSFLRSRIEEYKKEHEVAARNISAYVANPVNAYLLTKRLTSDWQIIEDAITNDIGSECLKNVTEHKNFLKFPTDEDLNGAAVGLVRLQQTYGLDTASIASGQLNGIQYSSQMSSHDCFEIGRQTYMNKDYHHTQLWMNEAMARSNDSPDISPVDILEYIASSTFEQGDLRGAFDITNEMLALDPEHDRALDNKMYFEKVLQHEAEREVDASLRAMDDSLDDSPDDESVDESDDDYIVEPTEERPPHYYTDYEQMCRNEIKQDANVVATLRCRYKNDAPFLKLAPLKFEEASLSPYIVVFHEVLADSEIDVIKKLVKPRIRRATVRNPETGVNETTHYRISKTGWLFEHEDDVIQSIGQRVHDMTGLTMKSAEELHVVNYGIGGQYEPHVDFAGKGDTNVFKHLGTGNRIATTLFYMSDVEQGGATVFPHIRVSVRPQKGSALFWWNLFESGDGDFRTRHAACPVLVGSKWVCTKWIHEMHQEFYRPCGLTNDAIPKWT